MLFTEMSSLLVSHADDMDIDTTISSRTRSHIVHKRGPDKKCVPILRAVVEVEWKLKVE
jgi:hypothetical protein